MEEQEIELIKQAKKGVQIAYTRLYERYKNDIRTVIYKYYTEYDIVEEILSISFIKAFKKLNSFIANDSFRAWLKTIAINTCIDLKRKDKLRIRDKSVDDESLTNKLISTTLNGEESLLQTESFEKLKKAIPLLQGRQRKAIEMYFFEKRLYREIANKLATPVNTIKSDIRRAKRKLKQIINNSI